MGTIYTFLERGFIHSTPAILPNRSFILYFSFFASFLYMCSPWEKPYCLYDREKYRFWMHHLRVYHLIFAIQSVLKKQWNFIHGLHMKLYGLVYDVVIVTKNPTLENKNREKGKLRMVLKSSDKCFMLYTQFTWNFNISACYFFLLKHIILNAIRSLYILSLYMMPHRILCFINIDV